MPSNQLHTDPSQGGVLSRVAQFPGLAGKLASVGKVRNLYRRVQHSPAGFRLGDVPELQDHCIFVDPFETDRSIESNRRALRQALNWLERGGMLAIFPS